MGNFLTEQKEGTDIRPKTLENLILPLWCELDLIFGFKLVAKKNPVYDLSLNAILRIITI